MSCCKNSSGGVKEGHGSHIEDMKDILGVVGWQQPGQWGRPWCPFFGPMYQDWLTKYYANKWRLDTICLVRPVDQILGCRANTVTWFRLRIVMASKFTEHPRKSERDQSRSWRI